MITARSAQKDDGAPAPPLACLTRGIEFWEDDARHKSLLIIHVMCLSNGVVKDE